MLCVIQYIKPIYETNQRTLHLHPHRLYSHVTMSSAHVHAHPHVACSLLLDFHHDVILSTHHQEHLSKLLSSALEICGPRSDAVRASDRRRRARVAHVLYTCHRGKRKPAVGRPSPTAEDKSLSRLYTSSCDAHEAMSVCGASASIRAMRTRSAGAVAFSC